MLVHLDAGSVVLGAVKRTSVTGPTAATTDTKEKADALILNDGRSTDWKTGGYGRHQRTGLQQFCSRRVPKMFTVEREAVRKTSVQT